MNVLTIDVDYAYSPSISAYDDFVVGSKITIEKQKEIFRSKNCEKPTLNEQKLLQIADILDKFKENTKIVVVQHHHEIIGYLDMHNDLYIDNIDHHHDIYYPGWHDLELLDEGNWVYHVSKNAKLKRYTWFRNVDSEPFSSKIKLNFDFIQKDDLRMDCISKPDIIVICASPHWTLDTEGAVINQLMRGTYADT
mgnify:CR=1 FL=1